MATAEEEKVDQVRMRKIREQESYVRELEIAYKCQQEETKNAREELSEAIARLRMLIRGEIEEQGELDFGGDDSDSDEPSQGTWDTLLSGTKLIDAISLTKAQRKKFDDLGVITVKHFEQLRSSQLPGIAGDLAGHFSAAQVDKLEDAVLDWMDRKRIERGSKRGTPGSRAELADTQTFADPEEHAQAAEALASGKPRTVGGRPVKSRLKSNA